MEPSILIAATTRVDDPVVPAWLTTGSYLCIAMLCGWTWWAARRVERPRRRFGSPFWLGMAVLFAALGLAKPFGLQAMLTDAARGRSVAGDWYEARRRFQFWFIVGVGVVASLAAVALGWLASRKRSRKHLGSLATVALLAGFLIVRATSFHDVDAVLYRAVFGVRINTGIELAILGLVAATLVRHSAGARRGEANERDEMTGARRYSIPGAGPSPR